MWGRKVSDLGFSKFVDILHHQSSKVGSIIHHIDRWFPSSKLCGKCGTVNVKLTLSDRIWICDCGVTHNRDQNAAINILREGASSLGLGDVRPLAAIPV